MESGTKPEATPFIGCDVCKQRKRYIQAKWATHNDKKGWWYLCEDHAKVVRQTLYGVLHELVRVERKDTPYVAERSD